jgi:hypothetical protein
MVGMPFRREDRQKWRGGNGKENGLPEQKIKPAGR